MPLIFTVLASLAVFVLGALLQLFHPLAQAATYHHFADCREWGPVHNAADVLSNLAILAAGLANLAWVVRNARRQPAQVCGMVIAAVGLILTAFGSAYYHFAPSDTTLVWDRLPITEVFAGILAMLWTSVTGVRAGWSSTLLLTSVSAGTVLYWAELGSLWPYALLQFGGMAGLAGLTLLHKVDRPRAWAIVIGGYIAAKVFEMYDFPLWLLTGNLFAGHALKHIASGFAGLTLLGVVSVRADTREQEVPQMKKG